MINVEFVFLYSVVSVKNNNTSAQRVWSCIVATVEIQKIQLMNAVIIIIRVSGWHSGRKDLQRVTADEVVKEGGGASRISI